ncbi:nuclear transport factor 2 family protein [Cupriavidus taiwanensis]|uniref:nuclear transport factor 2 family protein n=1 Tax=Cupriavidus taiwanensis TaxID=164546 RepID=UPI000E10A84D|nr:nuclear transport factor 2 family protein [Cupriavidus taiwanensis]SPA33646.1 putative phenazine biosynthesis protein [Cupriavidus taiwanensis]SPA54876.1 putative phenazine biosynthesis protein [Cupriavidus taiwanensis]
MTIATTLLHKHLEWLVDQPQQWRGLIADNIVWDLPYAPSLGHPVKLEGREAVLRHASWFAGAVKDFRFSEAIVTATDNPEHAIARVRGEGVIAANGRVYRQEYVVFLTAQDGRIVQLREYFDPVQAALALDAPVVGVSSRSI